MKPQFAERKQTSRKQTHGWYEGCGNYSLAVYLESHDRGYAWDSSEAHFFRTISHKFCNAGPAFLSRVNTADFYGLTFSNIFFFL